MRLALAAVAVLALALSPTAGTLAAWNDDAAVSSSGPLTALKVPPPVLTCTESGSDAVITWPQAVLAGPGMPTVGYTARVVETQVPLTVQGAGQRSVTVTSTHTGGTNSTTVEVTASVVSGLTTWTASATHPVKTTGNAARGRVTCF